MNFEYIQNLLREQMDDKSADINLDSKLKDDLGLCSLDMMIIITLIEKEKKHINLSILAKDMTVESLIKSIENEEQING